MRRLAAHYVVVLASPKYTTSQIQPIAPGTTPTVVAFAWLKIDSARKSGSNKQFVVELANNPDQGVQSAGVGLSYGAITPARLVQ